MHAMGIERQLSFVEQTAIDTLVDLFLRLQSSVTRTLFQPSNTVLDKITLRHTISA